MFGVETLTGSPKAVAMVGLVLAEAAALYVAYGGLERVVGGAVTDAVRGE